MGWQLLLAWSLGIAVASLSPALPGWLPSMLIGLAVVSALMVLRQRVLIAFVLGCCWFLVNASWQMAQQWPENRAGEIVEATVQIQSLPEWQGESLRFVALVTASDEALPRRVQLRWFRPSAYVRPGQTWSMTFRAVPPRGRLNRQGFDYTRFLLSQRIGALGTVRSGHLLDESGSIPQAVDRGRQFLAEVLAAESRSLTAAGLMRALAIADRSGLDETTRTLLADTGTAHLLAISGLHVGMVALLAGALGTLLAGPLILLWPSLDRRRVAWVVSVTAAGAYALLAGLTLPTQRALIMLAVVAGAYLARRGLQPGHALLLALGSILLLDPLAVLSTGLWLSFSAVAVLIWTFAWRPARSSGWRAGFVGLLRAQLAIGVGLLALNAGLFNQIQWAGFPANLLAIPLVTFWILPSLLLSVLLIALDAPATLTLALCEAGLSLLMDYLSWLHALGPDVLARPPLGLVVILCGLVGSLCLLAPPSWPGRWLGLALLLPVIWPAMPEGLDSDELEIRLLDVGRGQAILIGTREGWLLYDTGPGDGEGGDVLGRVLPLEMSALGWNRLDRVIISSDAASSRGGAGSLKPWANTDDIWASTADHGQPCLSGQHWQSGDYRFKILHPSPGLPALGPNSACVLWIDGPGGRVLLPGRVDAQVERRLINQADSLVSDVLVLSGGGHRNATSAAFLDALMPALALASVGRYDQWGRVHPVVSDRLDTRAIPLLTTGQCGDIHVRLSPDRPIEVSSAAGDSWRFWHVHHSCP